MDSLTTVYDLKDKVESNLGSIYHKLCELVEKSDELHEMAFQLSWIHGELESAQHLARGLDSLRTELGQLCDQVLSQIDPITNDFSILAYRVYKQG